MVWNFFLPDSIHGYSGGGRRRRDSRRRPPSHTLHAYVEKAQAVVVDVVDDGGDNENDVFTDGRGGKSCKDLAALLLLPPDVATASTTTTADSSTTTKGSERENVFDNSLSSSTLSSSISSFAVDEEIYIELDDDNANANDYHTSLPSPPVDALDVVFGSAPKSCFMSDRTDPEKEEDIDTEDRQDGILETLHGSSISDSSSNEKTGRTSSRRVHFYARVTVNRIPSFDALTVKEKTAMYYAAHEYRKMKQDVHNTLDVLMQRQQDGREDILINQSSDDKILGSYCHNDYYKDRLHRHPRDEEVSYCFDGLYTPEELAFREEAMVQSLCAVMSEQQFQWDNNDHYEDVGDDNETKTRTTKSPVIVGDDDPSEYIARAYVGLKVHHESTIRARRRGMYIESEVAEDEERQEAKWLATLPLTSSSSSLSEESSQRSSQHSSSADDTADENDDAVNNNDGTISLSSLQLSQSIENKDTVRCHQRTIYKAPKPMMTTTMHFPETQVDS